MDFWLWAFFTLFSQTGPIADLFQKVYCFNRFLLPFDQFPEPPLAAKAHAHSSDFVLHVPRLCKIDAQRERAKPKR